ncbi:MAG: hypothetical protein HRT35_08550 [Algicola sp.]|nr:hypothetical protein [Algicola sp.]
MVFRSQSNFLLLHHGQLPGTDIAKYLFEAGFVVMVMNILNDEHFIRICVADEPVMIRLAEAFLAMDE